MSTLATRDPVLTSFAADVGDSGPVAIEGSRSRWEVGGPLADGTRLLSAPTGIVAYQPEEMTVQVRAGASVAELHAELAARGQRTGLPDRGGTVGGAVAVGENVLEVLGRGPVRNAVLQVRYVSAEGQVVTGGGPVVKNVSGFNLPKLLVGSLGTLGLIVELVLRTNPVPAESRWLVADGADPLAVRNALFRPSAVLWDGTNTWVQLEGHPPDVAAELEVLKQSWAFSEVEGPPALPANRWQLAPGQLTTLASEQVGPFVASIGVGAVWTAATARSRPHDPTVDAVSDRMKLAFDPTGRLNPGRRPGGSS